jgi:transcription elongation GreA/GreB family factor
MRRMSRAFVKESDQAAEALPDLVISPYPNWVTPSGLAKLQARIEALESERREQLLAEQGASTVGSAPQDRATLARIERDLRYYRARLASARVVDRSSGEDAVRFGSRVTLRAVGGPERVFRIVGEDEAEPAAGLISWVSPLARALEGAVVGDDVAIGPNQFEVVSIER